MPASCMRTTFTEFTEPVKSIYAEQKLKAAESLNDYIPVHEKITFTSVSDFHVFLEACKTTHVFFYGIEKSKAYNDFILILDKDEESPLYWILTLSRTYVVPVSDKGGIKFIKENEFICAVFRIVIEYDAFEKLFTVERKK